MGESQVAAGVTIDIASGKDVHDAADRLLDGARHDRNSNQPIYQMRFAAAVTPSAGSTTTVLTFGKPRAGRLWNLVYLTVCGADDRTVVAGATLASYVGDPNMPTLHGLIDPANGSQVPASSAFGEKEIWIHDTEELFVIVYGAPTSQQLAGVARVLDYPSAAREATRI